MVPLLLQILFLSTLSLRRATPQTVDSITYTPFLSTLSLRRATPALPHGIQNALISIHALLAESDNTACMLCPPPYNFYPRSPCGERPHIRSTSPGRPGISIHALLAESDTLKWTAPTTLPISIHALLAESDTSKLHKNVCVWGFLSTLSLRRATLEVLYADGPAIFLSTLSLRRATHADR